MLTEHITEHTRLNTQQPKKVYPKYPAPMACHGKITATSLNLPLHPLSARCFMTARPRLSAAEQLPSTGVPSRVASRACCPMTSFGRSQAATHLREHGGRGARDGVRERWGAREVGWAPGRGGNPRAAQPTWATLGRGTVG